MWRNSVFVDAKESVHFYSSVEAATSAAGVSARENLLVISGPENI